MNKDIKIILIGFGSVGKRHYQNLLKMGYHEVAVFDPLDEAFKDFSLVKRIKEFNYQIARNYQVAFICNPNHLHIKCVLICAQAGCHLFIEKPLSHSLIGVEKLQKICQQKKLINLVACNMRFHPCLKFIKDYLERGNLSKIYAIHHEFGYYLPYWRPGQDYRKNYAAKKSTGGGIILDDLHEFDLLFWLNDFRKVKKARFVLDKVSNLKIESEDVCLAFFEFANKVLGSVRCDYLQQTYSRGCKIVGEKGNLEWDFKENVVWLKTKDKKQKLLEIKNYDLNEMYLEEIKYFFDCLKKRKATFNSIETAKIVLEYCIRKP